ncbi:MAG: nitronate monooxygenase [Chloroflexota bacterium]|nr:nitronate monooxygenase [Chloroflexota bacterium]
MSVRVSLETRLTDMLGIEYPIFQGGMAYVALPALVGAVSNAGGLGILTGTSYTPEQLRDKIGEVRTLTNKPFAINFSPACPYLEANLDICIEEKILILTYGRGRHTTELIIDKVKPHGIVCIPVVGNVRQALRVGQEGADAVIVSGLEGGGHVSHVSTLALLPQVISKINIPVIATGGFGDGKGLAAALALGAEGIQMGTRFICTQESPVPLSIKQMMLRATSEDTIVSGKITGLRTRVLKNKLTEKLIDMEDRKVPISEFNRAAEGTGSKAFVDGDTEWGSVWCGQIAGMIEDIPTCKELIERMVDEARSTLEMARGLFIS